jgi:hypothetical protein
MRGRPVETAQQGGFPGAGGPSAGRIICPSGGASEISSAQGVWPAGRSRSDVPVESSCPGLEQGREQQPCCRSPIRQCRASPVRVGWGNRRGCLVGIWQQIGTGRQQRPCQHDPVSALPGLGSIDCRDAGAGVQREQGRPHARHRPGRPPQRSDGQLQQPADHEAGKAGQRRAPARGSGEAGEATAPPSLPPAANERSSPPPTAARSAAARLRYTPRRQVPRTACASRISSQTASSVVGTKVTAIESTTATG